MSRNPLLLVALALSAAGVAVSGGCGGKSRGPAAPPRVASMPTPTVKVGECAVPERDGVMGASPIPRHADRDLDGDGQPETVVADGALCTTAGNCFWNVFVRGQGGACPRYAGTLAGSALEPLPAKGDDGFADVRSFWTLTDPGRFLVEEYHFVRGGYVSSGALLCKREDDDRLECAETAR